MQKNIDQFKKAKIKVLSFAEPEELKEYQKHFQWKMDIYSDPKRTLYQAFGLKKEKIWNIFHPKTILKHIVYFSKGQKMQKAKQDIYQMGGDFILDSNGNVQYSFRSTRPDDRPSIRRLLKELEKLS